MSRALLALALLILLAGCSTRRILRIDSDPTGARIWVNGVLQEKRTPVEIEFTHEGTFAVRLEKEGYQSIGTEIELKAGIEGYPLVDLVFETITRERRYARVVPLTPHAPDPMEADVRAVVRRAEAYRARTYREAGEAQPPERFLPSTEILP